MRYTSNLVGSFLDSFFATDDAVIERTATDAAVSRGAAAAAFVRPADDMVPRWLPLIRRVLASSSSIKIQE